MMSRCNLPPLVSGIAASLDKSNNLLLTWNSQGCDVMSYYVLIKKSTEVWSGAHKYVVKKTRSHILINKMPPGDYEIQIFATNRYGLSKPSDTIALKVEIGGRTGKQENHHEDVIKLSKKMTLEKNGNEEKKSESSGKYHPRTAASGPGFTAACTIPKTVSGATASPTPAKPNRGVEQPCNSHATASPTPAKPNHGDQQACNSQTRKTIEGFYKDLRDLEEHTEKAIFKLQSSVFENQDKTEEILCQIVNQQQIKFDIYQKDVKLAQKEETLKDALKMIQKWKGKLEKLKENQTRYRRQLMAAQEEAQEYLSNHEEKIHGLVEGVMADLRKELEELDF